MAVNRTPHAEEHQYRTKENFTKSFQSVSVSASKANSLHKHYDLSVFIPDRIEQSSGHRSTEKVNGNVRINVDARYHLNLAHQNRAIAIASDFRVDGAKSPEIPQQEGVLGSEIAALNRRSLATFHRTLNRNGSLLSLVSEVARFLGSTMGIAIANRKNCCDCGALSI